MNSPNSLKKPLASKGKIHMGIVQNNFSDNSSLKTSFSAATPVKQFYSSTELEAKRLQSIIDEMNHRATNPAYGLGVALGRWLGTRSEDKNEIKFTNKQVKHISKSGLSEKRSSHSVPLTDYYQKLFPQDTLRLLYIELDPGVDDGAALLQILARAVKNKKNQKKVEIVGIVPCVGNAVLSQTEQNTLQFLELTNNQNINVYPGAVAPLAIEQNQTAIEEMNKAIQATHFYGYDGEEDVGGWPKVTMKLQNTSGYKFAAARISEASTEAPLTLVSTSALTELSKTLTELERLDSEKGLPRGSFAKNINAIAIMGGCLNPSSGCNAPFDVPDDQKNSEANFYFDTPAAQNVFSICQRYGIPILLAPLDLTQQPGLLWTRGQVDTLNHIPNSVAKQMARVTNVIPYLDAPCFPNGTYGMHDLQTATSLLFPNIYTVTLMAITIGDVGQTIVNSNVTEEQKNVYVLGMEEKEQANFYDTVLSEYNNFNCINENEIDDCIAKQSPWTIGKIAAIVASGLAFLGLSAISAVGVRKYLSRRNVESLNEKKSLLNP